MSDIPFLEELERWDYDDTYGSRALAAKQRENWIIGKAEDDACDAYAKEAEFPYVERPCDACGVLLYVPDTDTDSFCRSCREGWGE